MKRKPILIIMAIMLSGFVAFALAGCEDRGESEEPAKTEEPRESGASGEAANEYAALAGDYQDRVSQRASLMLTYDAEADAAKLTVYWSSSAVSTTSWVMTGKLSDNVLSYSDCSCTELTYDEEGNVSEENTVYTGGEGYFEIAGDGVLKWTGAADEYCREAEFVLMRD